MTGYAIGLVGLDMDGTLLNSQHEISPFTQRVLEQVLEKGCEIVPVTGRPLGGVPASLLELPGVRYAITANGASVVQLPSGEFLRRAWLERAQVLQVLEVCRGLYASYDVFLNGWGYTQRSAMERVEEWAPRGMVDYIRASRRQVEDSMEFIHQQDTLEKVTLFFQREENRVKARRLLEAVSGLCVTSSLENNLEINAENATKGAALLWLAEHLGMKASQVMACGDSENDVSMLTAAGVGVAMGNARPAIQQQADVCTDTNDGDGVAKALLHFVLEAPQPEIHRVTG